MSKEQHGVLNTVFTTGWCVIQNKQQEMNLKFLHLVKELVDKSQV